MCIVRTAGSSFQPGKWAPAVQPNQAALVSDLRHMAHVALEWLMRMWWRVQRHANETFCWAAVPDTVIAESVALIACCSISDTQWCIGHQHPTAFFGYSGSTFFFSSCGKEL